MAKWLNLDLQLLCQRCNKRIQRHFYNLTKRFHFSPNINNIFTTQLLHANRIQQNINWSLDCFPDSVASFGHVWQWVKEKNQTEWNWQIIEGMTNDRRSRVHTQNAKWLEIGDDQSRNLLIPNSSFRLPNSPHHPPKGRLSLSLLSIIIRSRSSKMK